MDKSVLSQNKEVLVWGQHGTTIQNIKSVFFTKIKRGAKCTDRGITQTTYKKSKLCYGTKPYRGKNGVRK